jgi:hypothetical protein
MIEALVPGEYKLYISRIYLPRIGQLPVGVGAWGNCISLASTPVDGIQHLCLNVGRYGTQLCLTRTMIDGSFLRNGQAPTIHPRLGCKDSRDSHQVSWSTAPSHSYKAFEREPIFLTFLCTVLEGYKGSERSQEPNIQSAPVMVYAVEIS